VGRIPSPAWTGLKRQLSRLVGWCRDAGPHEVLGTCQSYETAYQWLLALVETAQARRLVAKKRRPDASHARRPLPQLTNVVWVGAMVG
jgi:hypothetical protein